MACLSPSPSGRRLSELLEEKQEPFFLDLHLLEKGCSSSRLLDGGYDTTTALLCWPAAPGRNDAAAAVLKRLTSKKQNKAAAAASSRSRPGAAGKKQPVGLLKLLLSKILHGKAANSRKKHAALQFSDSFKHLASNPAAVAPAPPCADHLINAVETDEKVKGQEAECSDSESYSYSYSDDDEKQLSPVSVLEHPFETSPVHGKLSLSPVSGKNAMDAFRDLLDAAYSPALLTQLLARSDDDLVTDTSSSSADDDSEDEDEYSYGYHRTSPTKSRRHDADDAAYWEAELGRVSELVAAEVPHARLDLDAAALRPEREDVGAAVEAAVFEALLRELVADLASSC